MWKDIVTRNFRELLTEHSRFQLNLFQFYTIEKYEIYNSDKNSIHFLILYKNQKDRRVIAG